MKKIGISGAGGLVGSRLVELLSSRFSFVPISSQELDIRDAAATRKHLERIEIDAFLHLAAWTDVDGAEKDPEGARLLNVEGTRNVFLPLKERGIPFILFSTDFVFDGNDPPYVEASQRNPISQYGRTKAEAEELVEGHATILRISYPYRAVFQRKRDFVRTLMAYLSEGKPVTLITDSVITPTYIDDIARVVEVCIAEYAPRIVHAVGASSLTPYEAGRAIARVFGYNEELLRQTSYDVFFSDKAARPRHSQILPSLGFATGMKTLSEGLEAMKRILDH